MHTSNFSMMTSMHAPHTKVECIKRCFGQLRVIQNCHHLHKHTQSMLEGSGVNGRRTFLHFFYYDALHFHMGPLKINIFKVIFWEGGRRGSRKKSTVCTLLVMLTILDDL